MCLFIYERLATTICNAKQTISVAPTAKGSTMSSWCMVDGAPATLESLCLSVSTASRSRYLQIGGKGFPDASPCLGTSSPSGRHLEIAHPGNPGKISLSSSYLLAFSWISRGNSPIVDLSIGCRLVNWNLRRRPWFAWVYDH